MIMLAMVHPIIGTSVDAFAGSKSRGSIAASSPVSSRVPTTEITLDGPWIMQKSTSAPTIFFWGMLVVHDALLCAPVCASEEGDDALLVLGLFC